MCGSQYRNLLFVPFLQLGSTPGEESSKDMLQGIFTSRYKQQRDPDQEWKQHRVVSYDG